MRNTQKMEIEKMRDPKEKEEVEELQTEIEMWKHIFAFTNIGAIKCAIELGIADAIENHKEPISLSELSSKLGCSPSSLNRIMRFLVHQNIFKEQPTINGTTGYTQTPLSRRLLSSGENSMAALFLLESSQVMLAPWHFLSSRVQLNGSAAFETAHGDDVWKFAAANPGHSKLINDAMSCNARRCVSAIVERCAEVFDGVKTLVDVGGGNGISLSLLVKAFPWIHGINFDLPHVVSVAPECDGVKHVGGDMFQCVPKADTAFIMWVLHDWNDDDCIQILKNCREAIPKDNGKVIIVDAVIGEKKDDKLEFVRLMLDMVMMAHTNTVTLALEGGRPKLSTLWLRATSSYFKNPPFWPLTSSLPLMAEKVREALLMIGICHLNFCMRSCTCKSLSLATTIV